jgi:S-formylglutathione hydrolase FrmB
MAGRRFGTLIGALGIVMASVGAGSSAGANPAPAPPTPARVVTITIPSTVGSIPAKWLGYSGPPKADVLLPAGYSPHTQYPLLVLLSGLANNYASYDEDGLVGVLEAAHFNAIVVMPEGANGWYADWWNDGERGNPSWETYELDDVLPTILANYPILPERQDHAIAGFSMGGLGAVYLAGRLPGFFGSVATLSGFVDTQYFAPLTAEGMGILSDAPFRDDENFDPVYGPPYGFYSTGHNPTQLTMNLEQTRVFESTGTGIPSTAGLTSAGQGEGQAIAVLSGSALEAPIIYPMNLLYHAALVAHHVDVTYQVHPGGHDIPDFFSEFTAVLNWGFFNPVVTDPTSWVNETVATSGQLWDIAYRFTRPPTAVVQFRRNASTLSLSAAGSTVTITANGCTFLTPTPATINLTAHGCT